MSCPDDLEAIARIVVDSGYRLHRDVGPGLLETAYELLLAGMLRRTGLRVQRQVSIPISYGGIVIDNAFKADLVVEGRLLVELKSVERLAPVHGKQGLTYLRFMRMPLGLLMNFGEATFKSGVRRIANDYFGPSR